MQIVEETAIEVATRNQIDIDTENISEELLNIDNNINIGTKYLSQYLHWAIIGFEFIYAWSTAK